MSEMYLGPRGGATTPGESSKRPTGGLLKHLSDRVHDLEATQAPIALTFGIELEFLLIGEFPKDRSKAFYFAQSLVVDALSMPLLAKCASCHEQHRFKLKIGRSHDPNKPGPSSGEEWIITTDMTAALTTAQRIELGRQGNKANEFGMELKSRIFTQGQHLPTTDSRDSPHRHCITPEQEIAATLGRLHEAFNDPTHATGGHAKVRMAMNESCGFHVHCGNASKGFSLKTVQALTSLYTAHERSIDHLHSTYRIGGTTIGLQPENTVQKGYHTGSEYPMVGPIPYNAPLSQRFMLQASALGISNSAQVPSNSPADWINVISAAPSVHDLTRISHRRNHTTTLNLENLREYNPEGYNNPKITVEFRQHAGTMDIDTVLSWLDVVTSLTHFSHHQSSTSTRKLIDEGLALPNYDPVSFLKTIGCKPSTMQHYRSVLGLDSGPSYSTTLMTKELDVVARFKGERKIPASLRALRMLMMGQTTAAFEPEAVKDRIAAKFKIGGYGQFSRAYLDGISTFSLSDEEKERLTDGWVNTGSLDIPYIAEDDDPLTPTTKKDSPVKDKYESGQDVVWQNFDDGDFMAEAAIDDMLESGFLEDDVNLAGLLEDIGLGDNIDRTDLTPSSRPPPPPTPVLAPQDSNNDLEVVAPFDLAPPPIRLPLHTRRGRAMKCIDTGLMKRAISHPRDTPYCADEL